MTTKTDARLVILDDGEFYIELDASQLAAHAAGFLQRRWYVGVTTPDGYECVGSFYRGPTGTWCARIDTVYDPVSDDDGRLVAQARRRSTRSWRCGRRVMPHTAGIASTDRAARSRAWLTPRRIARKVQPTIVHRWEHPEQRRYYEASLQLDLWGGWTVLRVWGQINSPRGGDLYEPIADAGAGEAALQRIARHRVTRGYSRVCRQGMTHATYVDDAGHDARRGT